MIVLTTTECLGVGIFEGHFLLFYLNPQSCHRPQKDVMHLSTQAWFEFAYACSIIMCKMLTCNVVRSVVVIATTVAVYVRHVHIDQLTCCTV